MNVLIVNSNRVRQPWAVIPFGAVCIATHLARAGHQVHVVDLCFSTDPAKDLSQAVARFAPDVVGVSVRNIDTAGYDRRFLLRDTRDEVITPLLRVFNGPVFVGGPAVGISAPEILRFLGVPFAIRGDGEYAACELVARLARIGSWKNAIDVNVLQDIAGLVWLRDGRIVVDNPPWLVADLNDLATPDFARFLDLSKYRNLGCPLPIQTKRGCSKHCTYCVYNKIEGHRYRLRSPQCIVDDLQTLRDTTGCRAFEFTDSIFNAPLDHAKAVLRAIVNANLHLRFRTMGLNPGYVDKQLVDLMLRAGFTEVDLGAEACCDAVLRNLGKDYLTSDIRRACEILHRYRLPITWFLLIGAPGETAETVRETLDTVNELASPWDLVTIGVGIRLYHGAPLARLQLGKNANCTEDNFLTPVLYQPDAISLQQLRDIAKSYAAKHPNYLLWDEEGGPPEFVSKTFAAASRFLRVRQPAYRLRIAMRTAANWLQKARG